MKNKKTQTLFLIFLILAINGCSSGLASPTDSQEIPFVFSDSLGRKVINWNNDLVFQFDPTLITNTMQFDSLVIVDVVNKFDKKVSFPIGYNLKIIDMSDQGKEISNNVTYNGPNLILEPKDQKIGSSYSIGFSPNIKDNSEKKLRIFVIGETLNDDTSKNQLVGAYLDILMHP